MSSILKFIDLIALISLEVGISPTEVMELDMEMFDALLKVINKKYDN